MYAPVIEKILEQRKTPGLLVPVNGCPAIYDRNHHGECQEMMNRNIELVAKLPRVRLIIIGTTWLPLANKDNRTDLPPDKPFLAGLDSTISYLHQHGKEVLVIGPVPTPGWDVASIASRSIAFDRPIPYLLFEDRRIFLRRFREAMDHFTNDRRIHFARMDVELCRTERCEYIREGRSLYADSNHLTSSAVMLFEPMLALKIEKALDPANSGK
jgi:hypothetical protein